MAERPADVQAHWTRPGVLARIDAVLTELGHDPQNLNPEILASVEHLHSGGLATTRDQTRRIALTKDSRVLDVGCGIGGPARYLAHTFGCRVDGIDLTPELIETGRVLTKRCKLADRVMLQVGNALELPYSGQTFDVVWCQNVSMTRLASSRASTGCSNPAGCSRRRNIQSVRVATLFSRCLGLMTPRLILWTVRT